MSDNFFKALEMLDEQPPQKIEFRLYYLPLTGEIVTYTMENLDGIYILITADEFAEMRPDVIVKDGKIHKVSGISIGKLVPAPPSTTGYGTLQRDISIVGCEQYWEMKTYE